MSLQSIHQILEGVNEKISRERPKGVRHVWRRSVKCLGLIAGVSFARLTPSPSSIFLAFARSFVPFACVFDHWLCSFRSNGSLHYHGGMVCGNLRSGVLVLAKCLPKNLKETPHRRLGLWVLLTRRAMSAESCSPGGISHAELDWQTNGVKDWKSWKSKLIGTVLDKESAVWHTHLQPRFQVLSRHCFFVCLFSFFLLLYFSV